jgi:hypothetical protein
MQLCISSGAYTLVHHVLTMPTGSFCRSMLKRDTDIVPTSNTARFKQLLVHCLRCGDSSCTTPGCLSSRDVLLQVLECDQCDRVSGGVPSDVLLHKQAQHTTVQRLSPYQPPLTALVVLLKAICMTSHD